MRIPKGDSTEQKDYPLADVQRVAPAARPAKKAANEAQAPSTPEENELPEDTEDNEDTLDTAAPDAQSVTEFAGEEGISEDEALAEIEEFSDETDGDLVDVEADEQ